ncbi:MAG: efflux RND transporter periplasmic adaptor subunit [Pseudomonadales bacterium]|nr:efflux RND transporter periplasmic adaptor subunit [Pseudomonadales bacterium]
MWKTIRTRYPLVLHRTLHAAAVTLLLFGCSDISEQNAAPLQRPVKIVEVKSVPLFPLRSYPALIVSEHEVDLGFEVGGKVKQRLVDLGDSVDKGQLLASLDAADFILAIDNIEANLAAAKSDLQFANAEVDRAIRLSGEGHLSDTRVDNLKNSKQTAEARLTSLNAQLAIVQRTLNKSSLYADTDGLVQAVYVEAGQVVSPGQPLFHLVSVDTLEVEFSVPEQTINQISIDQALKITLPQQPQFQGTGTIHKLAPQANPLTGSYTVKARIDNPANLLKPGMSATVSINDNNPPNVLMIPVSAIFNQGDKVAVWLFDPASSKVRLAPVELGIADQQRVVVKAGLKEGDKVITLGVHDLTSGQLVRAL